MNADSQWNPVYNAFHLIFVVETKRFVGSFVNVTLTRQTCGQRSSRAAECKHRALENCFSERMCYIFELSKCRRDRDLDLCTTSLLAFGEPCAVATSEKKRVSTQEKSDFAIFPPIGGCLIIKFSLPLDEALPLINTLYTHLYCSFNNQTPAQTLKKVGILQFSPGLLFSGLF